MNKQKVIDFIKKDRMNITTAKDLYWALNRLGVFEDKYKYSRSMLGPLGSYWSHKLEPNRDEIMDYIREKV
jgi:hypothetical protein